MVRSSSERDPSDSRSGWSPPRPSRLALLLIAAAVVLSGAPLAASGIAPVASAGVSAAGCDFDADGYDDLVLRLPGLDLNGWADAGAVDILYGSKRGPSADRGLRITQGLLRGWAERGDQFGFASTCGDTNRDGFDDLVVGSPGENRAAGRIDLIFGSAEGLQTSNSHGLISRLGPGARFGAELAIASLHPTSPVRHIVVGAPGADGGQGAIQLLGTYPWVNPGTVDASTIGKGLGSSLAVADLSGDGRDDIVAGAPVDGGSAIVVLGLNGDGSFAAAREFQPAEANLLGRYGAAIAAVADEPGGGGLIVVGDPRSAAVAGSVDILEVDAAGGLIDRRTISVAAIPDLVPGDNAGLGSAIVLGDFNSDGASDLALGLPTADVEGARDAGVVAVVYDMAAGGLLDFQVIDQGRPGIKDRPQRFDLFGDSLEVGDFDGDGDGDLAAYAPGDHGKHPYAGHLHTIKGSADGLTPVGDAKFSSKAVGPGQRQSFLPWTVQKVGAESRAGPATVVEPVVFGPGLNPWGANALLPRLLALIERADAGSEILIALYRVQTDGDLVGLVMDELEEAATQRQVTVRFVLDDNAATNELLVAIGERGFPVTVCAGDCLGGLGGAQHAKTAVFSSVDGVRMSVVSTGNWTDTSFSSLFEATLVIRELDIDRALVFDALRQRHLDFEEGRTPPGDGFVHFRHGNLELTLFPQPVGDVLVDDLSRVECSFVDEDGATRTTTVRLAVSWTDGDRSDLTDRLIGLHAAGCRVQLLAHAAAMPLLDNLAAAGFPVFADGSGNPDDSGAWCVWRQHAKLMTVAGAIGDEIAATAWLGSHNLGLSNLRHASDTWLQIDEPRIHKIIDDHIDSMFTQVEACP